MIQIELFGVPRFRAGVPRWTVTAPTVGVALHALIREFPALDDVLVDGKIQPSYRVNLNSDEFVTDLSTTLREGDALLLLSADVGG